MKSTIYSGQHVAHQCSMSESSFDDVNLQNAIFNNVNLQASRYSNINLMQGNFYDVNLSHAHFSYINLGGAVLSNIVTWATNPLGVSKKLPITFKDSDLSGSTFSNVDMTNTTLESCQISGLVINGVDIEALLKGDIIKPDLQKVGWRTQNETGSTNKVSKGHYMAKGSDKTLCGVDVPSVEKVAEMSTQIGTSACKRCLGIKKNY